MVLPYRNSFIDLDYQLLNKHFNIRLNLFDWRKKSLLGFYLIAQFFSIIFKVRSLDAMVIQFGGYWSLIPAYIGKWFNIPVYIILHGTDSAAIKELNYGSLSKPVLSAFCRLSYQKAKMLLPVSKSIIYDKNDYFKQGMCQGIKCFIPDLKTPFSVVHNGLDIDYWKFQNQIKRIENRFIAVFSRNQFTLKGGDLIVEVAARNKHLQFYIAGCSKADFVDIDIPENLHPLGVLTKQELREEYSKSSFHFQLSIFEGFGLSLCEAMLCGCIPIGSSVNEIPEIIGPSGFILKKRSADDLHNLVNLLVEKKNLNDLSAIARNRIVENYSLDKREQQLLNIIKDGKNEGY